MSRLVFAHYQQVAFPGNVRVPLEIQERVIDHLWDEPYYLISCRLVCRAWCIRSSQHFYRFIRIDNLRSLKRFNALLLSSDSAAYWARNLLSSKEDQHDDTCAHLIPYYTARNLPHLHHLEFSATIDHRLGPPTVYYYSNSTVRRRYDTIHCHFPCHPSMFMHLSQFRNVVSFTLTGYHFPSFNDLRRMVGALRALERLELIGVTWESGGDPFKSQIKTIPTELTHLTLRDCTSDFIGASFWIWTGPNSKVAPVGGTYAALPISASHPQLCIDDARALVDITDFVSKAKSLSKRAYLQGISYEWIRKSETSWIVTCGQDTPMYPEPLFSLMVETTIPPSQFSATSRSIDTNRALTTNFSGAFDFFDAANIHNFDWKHLDHLLNGLHNLQSLRITLQSRSLITVDQSPDWGNPERLTEEMRFWKGQNIQRSSIEEELPHAEEMKTNPLPLMGVWTAKEMGINPAALWGSWQGFPSPSFGGLNPPREIEAKVGVDELVEKISQQRAKGLGLVQEQMPLMKPLLSLII